MKNWSFKGNKREKFRAVRGFVCCQGHTSRRGGFGGPKPLHMDKMELGSQSQLGGAHLRASMWV